MNQKPLRLLVALAAMAVVAYMSLKTSYPHAVQSLFDNLGSVFLHFLAYGGLVALFFWTFLKKDARGLLLAGLFSVSYGLFLEVLQLWVPGRSFSLMDIGVNCLGAMVGVVVVGMGVGRGEEG